MKLDMNLLSAPVREWVERALQHQAPYGLAAGEMGLLVVSVVMTQDSKDRSGIVSTRIGERGSAVWRIANLQSRPRRFNLSAAPRDDRIRWTDSKYVQSVSNKVRIQEDRFPGRSNLTGCYHEDYSASFDVVRNGSEAIRTTFSIRRDYPATSLFEVVVSPGAGIVSQGEGTMIRFEDVFEALKALPFVGPALSGIVLRRLDRKRVGEANLELQRHLQEGHRLTTEILAEVLGLKESMAESKPEAGETLMVVELVKKQIESELGISYQDLPLTKWPLPFSEQVLRRELHFLFLDDMRPFRVALTESGWIVRENQDSDQVIGQFIKDMVGRDRDLLPVFQSLSRAKESSVVLGVAAAYLGNRSGH